MMAGNAHTSTRTHARPRGEEANFALLTLFGKFDFVSGSTLLFYGKLVVNFSRAYQTFVGSQTLCAIFIKPRKKALLKMLDALRYLYQASFKMGERDLQVS